MKLLAALVATALATLLALVGIAIAANPLPVVTKTAEISRSEGSQTGKGAAAPRCRGGRFAVAGGFVSEAEPGQVERRANVFSSSPSGQRWRGAGVTSAPEGGEISVSAYCSKRKPAVRTESISIPTGQTRTLRVRCPRGKEVVGIGYQGEFDLEFINGSPSGRATLVYAARRASAREAVIRGASMSFGGGRRGRLIGRAVCAESPRLSTFTASAEVAPGTDGNARAQCPRGSVAMFGGFEQVLPNGSAMNVAGGVADSVRAGDRAWRVRLVNDGGIDPSDLEVRSYVYCAR